MVVEGMVEDFIKFDVDINMIDEWGRFIRLFLEQLFICSFEVRYQFIYEWVRFVLIVVFIYKVMYVMLISV